MNILEKIKLGRLLLKLYNQVKEPKKMWKRLKQDPKTTVTGILAVVAQALKLTGIELPTELLDGISLVCAGLFALLARDSHPPDVVPK